MKKSFLLNMLGILCGIFGVALLGSVEITVSATLFILFPAALLLVACAGLLSAGLAAPARPVRRTTSKQVSAPIRRAA